MSFNIGPYIGKRDAVIKAVKAYVDTTTKAYPNQQLSDVSELIVAELAKSPETQTCAAHAWGHADVSGRWASIGVNQILAPTMMTPYLVE
jgi:hypothetical protein